MTTLRLLVGTRKGAFVLTSDERRKDWKVEGPHFAGWEVYHVNASPADSNRLYASTSRGWFGQVIQRSDDGGATWQPTGNEFHYEGTPGTHKWYDNTDHPWEFARVWHFEPSLTDPDTVYAGVEDAALFKSTNGGASWEELSALRTHKTAPTWNPGAGGLCLHTIILDPKNPNRIFTAISSAGSFRSDDSGKTWQPINRGLKSGYTWIASRPEPQIWTSISSYSSTCFSASRIPFSSSTTITRRGLIGSYPVSCTARRPSCAPSHRRRQGPPSTVPRRSPMPLPFAS